MAPAHALTGPPGTRATAGQRPESIAAVVVFRQIDAHDCLTLSFSTDSVRGTTGTRRSHSVMPCTRMPIAPISGASGATSCSRSNLADARAAPCAAQGRDEGGLVVAVQRDPHVELVVGQWGVHQVVPVDGVER